MREAAVTRKWTSEALASKGDSSGLTPPSEEARSALLLLRTPFQAWIAEQVLRAEGVAEYELLYFTQHDSVEDRHYFRHLAEGCELAKYCYAPVRLFDILGHLDFRRRVGGWYRDRGFDLVLLASIDAFVPNAIARRQRSAALVTFDDGTGNFNSQGIYHVDRLNPRGRLYRRMFGATDLKSIHARVVRHYTMYPQFTNIVGPDRMRMLAGWQTENDRSTGEGTRNYFIGAPFEQVMTADQIRLFEGYLRGQKIDYYVKHPRERRILEIGVPLLDKGGRIAEDAIVLNAGEFRIHVIGWFSTVLFNLGAVAQRRTMVLFRGDPRSAHMAQLAETAGCETVFL